MFLEFLFVPILTVAVMLSVFAYPDYGFIESCKSFCMLALSILPILFADALDDIFNIKKLHWRSVEDLCEKLVSDAYKSMAYNERNNYEDRIFELKKRLFLGRISIEEIEEVMAKNSYDNTQTIYFGYYTHNGYDNNITFGDAEEAHDELKDLILEILK